MNRIMAVAWLVLGGVILVWQAVTGTEDLYMRFGGVSFSGGWVALVLALYNLARWWGRRSYRQAQREAERQAEERRQAHRETERAERQEAPNPDFDFSDRPPPG